MFSLAAILFAVTALGGITTAVIHLNGRDIPMPLAVLHGLAAVAGLIVLIAAASAGATSAATTALALFIVAALGGLVMFFGFYLRGKRLPNVLIFMHGLVAVAAFVFLMIYLFSPGAIREPQIEVEGEVGE